MAKYAMFSTPGHGHVNPTLALTQELVARGEQVIYYLTDEFRPAVEATGATFRSYSKEMFWDSQGCHTGLCVKITSKQVGKETRAEQRT